MINYSLNLVLAKLLNVWGWRYLVLRRLKEGSILSSSVNVLHKEHFVENIEVKELEKWSKARFRGPASWSLLGVT